MAVKKRFNVVVSTSDGGVRVDPMKEWLRQHPDRIPAGLDPTSSNSHQLRDGLKKSGWLVQETPSEVRLLPPETASSTTAINTVLGDEAQDEDYQDGEASFALEYQLRDFIAQNLAAISVGGKHLKPYVDQAGRDGIEYPSSVGPIDILAVDDSGAFVVFELKRASSPDRAIGQLARYMGWVRQTIGKDRDVSGVIVAKDVSENLRYAASVFPNVSLFEYEVEFHLKPAHDLQVASAP